MTTSILHTMCKLLAVLCLSALAEAQFPPNFDSQFFGAECFRQGDGALIIGGNEISITRFVRNPSACQVLCTREPNCAFFNFFSTGGFCVLFDAYALTSPLEDPMTGVTFGPRVCDCYLRPARKLISGTVAPINGPSFAQALSPMDCQAICQRTEDCQFFEYEATGIMQGNCVLYDEKALGSLFRPNLERDPAFTSGPRSCVGCFTSGRAIVDLGKVETINRPIGSAIFCQFLCFRNNRTPPCAGFNYFPGAKECQLYFGENEPVRAPNADAVTGPPLCQRGPGMP